MTNDAKDDETDLAETRTKWAEDRTIMANERTFSSWMGTGLGAIGVAIGLKAVFGAFDPTWAAKAVASLFLAVAVAIFWSARNKACATLARLNERDVEATPSGDYSRIAAALSVAAVATGAILWAL
jgi:putative membrane protein